MIFSKKNAGRWVASKGKRVVATDLKLSPLVRKMEDRKDKDDIRYTLVPHFPFA